MCYLLISLRWLPAWFWFDVLAHLHCSSLQRPTFPSNRNPPLPARCVSPNAALRDFSGVFFYFLYKGRRELLENVWGFSCNCPRCENDAKPGSSPGDWRVMKMLQTMEALLENAEARRCGNREPCFASISWGSEPLA